jgi:hypothetical protein
VIFIKGKDFLKSIKFMHTIETLNSSKFDKFEMYQVNDASKIYGGVLAGGGVTTQIQQSNGQHWDVMPAGSTTNLFSDGGFVGGLVTTSYIPAEQAWWAAHQY